MQGLSTLVQAVNGSHLITAKCLVWSKDFCIKSLKVWQSRKNPLQLWPHCKLFKRGLFQKKHCRTKMKCFYIHPSDRFLSFLNVIPDLRRRLPRSSPWPPWGGWVRAKGADLLDHRAHPSCNIAGSARLLNVWPAHLCWSSEETANLVIKCLLMFL